MIDIIYHMTMTLQELTYLVAIADHLHFGRAAAACHVTQPSLSAGVRSLERKLDLVLCERGPRGVRITRAAEPVIEAARRVLAEARRLENLARRGQTPLADVYRLGAIPTIGPYLFPHVIGEVRAAWPELRLHLVEAKTAELLRGLRRGDLDAALASPPLDAAGLRGAPLYREEFVVALPPDHPLGHKRTVRLQDLADEPLLLLEEGHCLRDQVVEYCRIGDAAAREMLRSGSLETLRNMVAAGMGTTLLPALAVPEDGSMVIRRLTQPVPSREVHLYWRPDFADAESAQLLAKTLRRHLPDAVHRLPS